jgi:hypothetical protein
MRIRHLAFVAFAATAMLSAAGCKRAAETASDAAIAAASGGKVEVSRDGGTTTIATGDGKQKMTISAGADVALPASFPKDVFLPADYKVESAMELPNAMIVHVLATGTLEAIAPEADKAMQAQGWKPALTMADTPQAHIVSWEKGERHATLTLAGDAKQNGVQVGYQLSLTEQ